MFSFVFCLFICTLVGVSACEHKNDWQIVPRVLSEFFGVYSSFMTKAADYIHRE